MFFTLKQIFVFALMFGVFTITLQASIIHICKENKIFKIQNSAAAEEEEESHETNDSENELIYLNHDSMLIPSNLESNNLFLGSAQTYISVAKTINIPPPKF